MNDSLIRIRQADPRADRDRILAVLSRNLPPAAPIERHAWLYLSNPCGPSRVWLALHAKTGEAIGTSAGHPKKVRINGRIVTALNLSDFAIDRPYRSLGPALSLLRGTLEPMDRSEFAFSYDHPSQAMLAIYKRMGGHDVGHSQRLVRLLRLTPVLRRRWGKGLKADVVGGLGDAMLGMRDRVHSPLRRLGRAKSLSISLLRGTCGEEFDRLDETVATDSTVRLVRSSEYLRWRFLDNATGKHEILCARRGRELVGYLIFRPARSDGLSVVDLVSTRDSGAAEALIDELVPIGRARAMALLEATALGGSPSAQMLSALGFRARDSSPGVVIYGPKAGREETHALEDPNQWWTLEGDQDV
jgi:hypothetical protein